METEEELHRKALEQVARLVSQHEAGILSVEAFRVAIETIWSVLGGVVTVEPFQDLMTEANEHLRTLPEETSVRLFADDGSILAVVRTGEQVRLHTAAGLKGSFKQFGLVTEAATYVARVATSALSKGMREIPA